jgi:hypothetical protein
VQQAADRSHVLSQVQSAADTKASSKLNRAVAVLSGSGGAGKTSACLAIQGKPLPAERESTRGGDGIALVVRVKKEELLGFEKPRDDLNDLQRALLQRLKERGASEDVEDIDLSRFVSGLDAHENIAELQRQLEAMGGGLAAAAMDELQALEQTSMQRADAPAGSLPHGGAGAPSPGRSRPPAGMPPPRPVKHSAQRGSRPKPMPKAAVPTSVVPEQIQVKRETAIVMRAQQATEGHEDQDGVHTLIVDLGGQPEFWPLVGEFLRE